jgi:hypothetical protein
MRDDADRAPDAEPAPARQGRKARDAGLILPLLGAAALMPPVASAFAIEGRLFGVPVVLLYVFGVWALLILLAVRVARALSRGEAGGGRP